MSDSTYGWMPGWRPAGISSQAAGEAFEAIKARRKELTAEAVVEESRDPKAPLHPIIFHIPPQAAAEKYYLERARKVMQALVFVSADVEVSTRAFHFVKPEFSERQYVAANEVALDPLLRSQVTEELKRKLKALRNELVAWQEFSRVVSVIDEHV